MKKNVKHFILVCILSLFLFAIPVFAHASNDTTIVEENRHCSHSFAFEFDDETMTIDGVYTINTIEWLMDDVECFGDKAVVYENGTMLTEGLLQEGMSIEIYHDDQLYGTYTIEKLSEMPPEIQHKKNNSSQTNNIKAGNDYG